MANGNDDLINFIATTVEELRDGQESIRSEMREGFSAVNARLDDLRNETRTDLTALRGDMEQVHLRLDNIEKALTNEVAQIRTEVSRLRSAVYLLAKDRPEVLRLLGPSEQQPS